MFPLRSLKGKQTSFCQIEEYLSYALFLGKDGHFVGLCDLLNHFWIDQDNIWSIEHVSNKNVNLSVISFMSVVGIIFCLDLLEKLIIKWCWIGHEWQLYDFVAMISEFFGISGHSLFGKNHPNVEEIGHHEEEHS